jgi:GNAT superfamily N-acetyltransferase
MIAVRKAADPDRTPPRLENLRHNLTSMEGLVYLVALADREPVGCGFVYSWAPGHAEAHLVVVPTARRRGVGSELLAAVAETARAAGKAEIQGQAREDDRESRAYFERRGFAVVGGEKAVALDLAASEPPAPEPPEGVRIVSRAERPDLVEKLYPLVLEAVDDIPGATDYPTYEQWRAVDVDRPTRRPELFFIALAGDEPVGCAVMDDLGSDVQHGLTTVTRAWRRRGVATALKLAQISAARDAGFRRAVTGSEERNEPMRALNEKLGYRPEPSLSGVVLRGPADVRLPHGDG